MSDGGDNRGTGDKVRSLTEAMRRVRTAEAERSDVVIELRDAERARLEMLADDLKDVFAEVPAGDEQFALSIGPGTPPRLWIDLTAFVAMGRDHRTYRFLKDTRLGRTVIVESDEMGRVADTVTTYIAERIIERERAIEGEWVVRSGARSDRREVARRTAEMLAGGTPAAVAAPRAANVDRATLGWLVAAFLGGLLIGAIALLIYAWSASG